MAQTTILTPSEALYRFFAAFDGFDDAHTLGYEAECPQARRADGGMEAPAVLAAVFSMEPTLTQVRKYVNGGGTWRGACTVSGRVRDDDCAQRQDTAAFFDALADYVRRHGAHFADGGRVYEIRPAAHPARLRLTADGAVWELRCAVGIQETGVNG